MKYLNLEFGSSLYVAKSRWSVSPTIFENSFLSLFHCLPGFRCIKLCLIIVFHFLSCSKRRGKRSAKDRMCEKIPNSTLEGESLACKMNQYFLTEIVQKERHLIGRDLSLHEATCCTNWCMYWYCWKMNDLAFSWRLTFLVVMWSIYHSSFYSEHDPKRNNYLGIKHDQNRRNASNRCNL